MSRLPAIGIAGTGRAARALAARLVDTDCAGAVRIWGRRADAARDAAGATGAEPVATPDDLLAGSTWLLLAVRDDAVAEVAREFAALPAARGRKRPAVALHLAGALSRAVLAPLAGHGIACGVFHPVVALTGERSADRLRGATATISGTGEARRAGRDLASALGLLPVEVDDDARPLVHLACVMAAGDVVALLGLAEGLLTQAGVAPSAARRMLARLAESAARTFETAGPADGLTGPLARADAETLARHRQALRGATAPVGAVHRALTRAALERLVADGRLSRIEARRLARASGLPEDEAAGTTRNGRPPAEGRRRSDP